MSLPPDERSALADRLWFSVNYWEEVQEAWDEEIARRIGDIDAGRVEPAPWETVLAGLRAKLG